MTRKNGIRKAHLRWLESLLWKRLNVQYDAVSYRIIEEVLFTRDIKPNMAALGREYSLSREAMSRRLKRVERDLKDLREEIGE